ncbi:MAG: hypothetical protein M3Y91_11035 [Actinomycetota bacterium]|nr:hypothetical protein [Actinomycetota bacterium]
MIVGVVISNLLYLIVALAVAVIGALVVVLRHRKPKSVEANVASFHRGLRALAPDQPSGPSGSGPSWGGASRRAATTPTSFKRPASSGGEEPSEMAPAGDHDELAGPEEDDHVGEGDDELDVAGETSAEEGSDVAGGDVDGGDVAGGDVEGGGEAGGGEAGGGDEGGGDEGGDEDPSGVDPVHLESRKRRPSSGSASRADDESGVPTEEAGTG